MPSPRLDDVRRAAGFDPAPAVTMPAAWAAPGRVWPARPPFWAAFLHGSGQPWRVALVALAGLGLPLALGVSHAPVVAVIASLALSAAAVAAIATTDWLSDDGLRGASRSELANAAVVHGLGAAGAVAIVIAILLAVLIAAVVICALLAFAANADG